METPISSFLQSIDAATLTPIVRQSLRRNAFQLLSWQMNQFAGGFGNPVSLGLYRFAGTGQDRDQAVPWSVILKLIQSPANVGWVDMGEGEDQSHWNYWKRETLVYQSDLLETLPDGMVAPRCFGLVELPGNIAGLWLEDVVDSYGGVWTLDRYALTARHLGRLNGFHGSSRPLPAFPWLSNNLTRQWSTSMIDWPTFPWDHPGVVERYLTPENNPLRRMLLEIERFQAKLDLLPRALCHGDTYPSNFMSRRATDGQEQTVALDWALAGIGPVGDDLGQFVLGACMNLQDARRADVDKALFASYLDGLRECDCRVDPQWVRFSFTASAALRIGLFQLMLLGEDIKQGEAVAEDAVQHPDVRDSFEVAMANEAIELLQTIR